MTTEDTHRALAGFSDALADAVELAGKNIVTVNARRRTPASGVHWRPGLIVTANHVVERDDKITIRFGDGEPVEVTLAGRDPSSDLALLKVAADGRGEPASIETAGPKVGQFVLAVGRPSEYGLSASFGAVSSISSGWRTPLGGKIEHLIQPDVTFYPGFSGGGLVSASGGILGVNTSGLAHGATVTIPSQTVDRVVDQLLASGRIVRGFLGVRMQGATLSETSMQQLGLADGRGLLIIGVEKDGPAEKAGVLIGDVLISIGQTPVAEPAAVQAALDPEMVSKPVDLRIIRGGVDTTVTATVGERPPHSDQHGHGPGHGHGHRGHGAHG